MSNKYLLSLEEENKRYLNIELSCDLNMSCKYISYSILKELQEYKNKIVKSNEWDKNKKFTNDYELVYISNRNNNDSIALYKPLSRAYFKMIEMINTFNLITYNKKDEFFSGHLAEGPGGFLEALYNKSRETGFKKYKYYGITLVSNDKDVPGWYKAYNFLKNKNDIIISSGKDGTGNLYNIDNILHFRDTVGKNKCHIVTADGGFDFSINFNKQEQLSYRLIISELVSALSIQRIGGHFVCKVFDLYTISSSKILYFICCFYKEVYIYKPLTSRPANSEKYIIAKGFIGIDEDYLQVLFTIIKKWENLDNKHYYVNDIFGDTIPNSFLKKIKEYNKKNSEAQIQNIKNTIELINKKKTLSFLNNIIKKQIMKAQEWCNKYNEVINYESNLL